jgi:hypothetical protein
VKTQKPAGDSQSGGNARDDSGVAKPVSAALDGGDPMLEQADEMAELLL